MHYFYVRNQQCKYVNLQFFHFNSFKIINTFYGPYVICYHLHQYRKKKNFERQKNKARGLIIICEYFLLKLILL